MSHSIPGKCPACKHDVRELHVITLPAKTAAGESYAGAVYCCPSCNAVLGAGIDPVLLTNQILNQLRR
jgi:hypothetical protein